jgi:hypothetical protein
MPMWRQISRIQKIILSVIHVHLQEGLLQCAMVFQRFSLKNIVTNISQRIEKEGEGRFH